MQLFTPSSKVQRDRKILRESDAKLAKYSRRGLVFSLVAYTICLAFGYLRVLEPKLAVFLTAGLFTITVLRGFFLLRFEAIYAKGPQRWRNLYFASTLIGAAWWTVILIAFTLSLGMIAETPILWIYTVIFQATVTSSLSPYKKFSHIYQFISIVPPALAALWMGGFNGYMYSLMMLIFYLMLYQQVETLHDNFWQRLEANFALTQRTKVLEAEKRNVNAAVDLSGEFLTSLGHEFRTSLNDILGGLTLLTDSSMNKSQQDLLKLAEKAGESQLDLINNIVDFSKINTRTLVLENSIFNLRAHIEQWIAQQAVTAHQQNIELDFCIAQELPLRVNGDVKRVAQVFNNLLGSAMKLSEHGRVSVHVAFIRNDDAGGFLEVDIIDQCPELVNPEVIERSSSKVHASNSSLWLSLCKGLTECMNGTVEVLLRDQNERQYKIRLPLEVSNRQPSTIRSFAKLNGRRMLLLSDMEANSCWLEEVQEWGLMVETVNSLDQAQRRLDDASASEHPINILLISYSKLEQEVIEFSRSINADPEYKGLRQMFFLLHTDTDNRGLMSHVEANDNVASVFRPVLSGTFHEMLCFLLFDKPLSKSFEQEHDYQMGKGKEVLLVDDHRVNQMVAEAMLKKMGYSIVLASNGVEALKLIEERPIDVVLMDCQMPEMDGFDATKQLRKKELEQGGSVHLPVIAMTAHTDDSDKVACFAAGMDDYLAKPVRYDDLEARLIRWLGH